MVDVSHEDDDPTEQFDTDLRVPGVAFDVGQAGFPKVLVVKKIADSVADYDAEFNDGEDAKATDEYAKNVLVRTQPDDAVYQVVYLTDSPLGRTDFNDPKSRYPMPESRLFPFRHWNADPVDNSEQWDPRTAVTRDVLVDLFDTARAFSDGPSVDELHALVVHSSVDVEAADAAREYVESADYENVPDDMEMSEVTELDVDDGDGPDMELKQVGEGDPDDAPDVTPVGDEADSESETDAGDPPEAPDDGGPDDVSELDDEQLGDFDPSDEL